MAFRKKHIVHFTGLDANMAPELIKYSEASDLINFRAEKIGKLVSRSGGRIAIGFFQEDLASHALTLMTDIRISSVRGIGELILREKWADIDTDRLMVYYVTLTGTEPDQSAGTIAVYLLVPITGSNRWNAAWRGDLVVPGVLMPGAFRADTTVTFALPPELKALTGLVQMNQFRHKLVVSDFTNGDILIWDKFAISDLDTCETTPHEIRAGFNTLAEFNIDAVRTDYQLGQDELNGAGVLNGMALYRYVLPKKDGRPTRDHFADVLSNEDHIRTGRLKDAVADVVRVMRGGPEGTLIHLAHYQTKNSNDTDAYTYDGYTYYSDVRVNTSLQYTFSNFGAPGEFDDALGRLELPEQTVRTAEGEAVERGADIYVWEDYKLNYYPSGGQDLDEDGAPDGINLLRAGDRFWTKSASGLPRITPQKEHSGSAAKVALGAWRYRFVWDFGGGDYSAPSAPMMAGDLLWSAVRDTDFETGKYERAAMLETGDELMSHVEVLDTDYGNPPVYPLQEDMPRLFTADTLTQIGLEFFKLKHEIFGYEHRYGAQFDYDETTDINALFTGSQKREERGRLGTLVTAFFSKSSLEMDGFIFESAKVDADPARLYAGKLVIPIFQIATRPRTYNAVFSDEGKYRKAWLNLGLPRHQLVWRGNNGWIAGRQGDRDGIGSDLLYNLVADQRDPTGDQWDHNNEPMDQWEERRACTLLRAIRREEERLIPTRSGLPPQALERLILRGSAELVLAGRGEPISWESETSVDGFSSGGTFKRLHRVTVRESRQIGSPAEHNGLQHLTGDITNCEIIIYGEAERFIGIEQLTSYFPTSLLFGAPRVQLTIEDAMVPPNAKGLLIFRTKASSANDHDPNAYGLAHELRIERYGETNVPIEFFTGQVVDGAIRYFDDVKDDELDFDLDISEFEGLRFPLKSRFNIPLDERLYYANYVETDQPTQPRGRIQNAGG